MNIFYCKSLENLIAKINEIIKSIYYNENQITKNESIHPIKRNNIKKITKRKSSQNLMTHDCNKEKPRIKNKSFRKNKNKKKLEINKNDLKRLGLNQNILEFTESELNSISYEMALKLDKRSYIQYYWSLLKKNQLILFSFYPNKDYNSQIIKSFLFFFYYSSDITVNALFFTDDTMHKIYVDSGLFNFKYQLPQIIYSSFISKIINLIIEYLSSSENTIISIKSIKFINLLQKMKIIKRIKLKFLFFFVITFILLLAFWYYVSCFCYIYNNTQIHLITDSLNSFGLSLIYPFFIDLIPGIFRISALRNEKGDKSCIYKLSQIIEFFS